MSNFENTNIEISLDDLHIEGIEDSLAELANEKVMAGGTYLAKGVSHNLFENEDGRQIASLSIQVYNEEGRELRRIRAKVSWQVRHAYGRADKAFRLYASLAKALDADARNPVEVLTLASQVYFMVSFNDAYAVKEDSLHPDHADKRANDSGDVWVALKGDSDEAKAHRLHYLGQGYDPIYLTNNFFPQN